jgi:hypothetical protein
MIYQDGARVYEGYWKNDLRHGEGYERFKNGNVYIGALEGGKPHGKGVYTWKN